VDSTETPLTLQTELPRVPSRRKFFELANPLQMAANIAGQQGALHINLPFPRELRDMINLYIFKQDSPILILPVPAASAQQSPFISEHAIPDMDLLTLCPAYQNEALEILYSKNTFRISNLPDTYIDAVSSGFLDQWLRSIGPTHQDEVRKVLVDLTPLCPWPTRGGRVILDLKAMVMQLWRRQNTLQAGQLVANQANIQISFTLSGRQLHNLCHHPTGAHLPPSLQYTMNIQNLNTIIRLLRPDTHRGNMKYLLHSPRTLCEIRARVDGRQVRFVLATPNHQDRTEMGTIMFDLNASNQIVRQLGYPNLLATIWMVLNVTTPKEYLLAKLLDLLPNPRETTYNMNNGTTSHALPVALWIEPRLRETCLNTYSSTHVIAKTLSSEPKAPMRCFGCWEKWIVGSRLFTQQRKIREDNAPNTLTRFDLSQNVGLDGLRIPITYSMLATLELLESTEICVEMACPNTPIVVSYQRLRVLQRRLMVFLTDLLDNDSNPHVTPCPEIWMDGHCKMVEAEFEHPIGVRHLVSKKKYGVSFDKLEDNKEACINQLLESARPATDKENKDDG
jgi:hypothetical protein